MSNKSSEDNELLNFISKYWGAFVGGVIALIIATTALYRIAVGIVLIIAGLWFGYYLQHNKEKVKEKLKKLIDKM